MSSYPESQPRHLEQQLILPLQKLHSGVQKPPLKINQHPEKEQAIVLICPFQPFAQAVILRPDSKPYQMKLIEKIAGAFGVFSPILILLFACASYLSCSEKENIFPGEQIRKEIKQNRGDEETGREDVPQSLLLNKPY